MTQVGGHYALDKRTVSRLRKVMHSHEVLREVYQKVNPKVVADAMNLSLSMIYKWAEPSGDGQSGAVNPLDRIESLVQCTDDPRITQWICERAGGFFIRNPKSHWPHPFSVIPATNQIVQEFADLLSVVATAAKDNHVTRDEAVSIRSRWEQLKSVTEGFVRCCEEGNFQAIRESEGDCPRPNLH
jgi:hypothetical protein